MIVYLIENSINNKLYIGQTTQSDKNYFGSGTLIKNAIKKHGRKNFKRTILKKCNSMEKLNSWEAYFIGIYNTLYPTGYNLMSGGNGNGGHSNETKEKIRLNHLGMPSGMKGKKISDEQKRKISEKNLGNIYWLGKRHTKETKQKISKTKLGIKRKPFTEKHKQNMSIGHVGMTGKIPWNKGLTKKSDKRVAQYAEKIKTIVQEQFSNGRNPWNKKIKTEE